MAQKCSFYTFIYCGFCCILIELILKLILGSMTDSVCTAYESRKQHNNISSTIKGTLLTTKYDILV